MNPLIIQQIIDKVIGQNGINTLPVLAVLLFTFSIFENVNYRQDLKLFSNYLEEASNVDLDYLVQIDFDVNPLLSTQLIFQLIYDDNAVSRLQVREVFGIGAQLKLN